MKHNLLLTSTLFLFLAICGDEIAAQSKLPLSGGIGKDEYRSMEESNPARKI